MSVHTYYYLTDYCDEICAHVPSLEGIQEWLDDDDPNTGRGEPTEKGEQFNLVTLSIIDWCKATWAANGWELDKQFPTMDFLAVVDDFGDQHWVADDILWGESFADMMDNYVEMTGRREEDIGYVWIVCGEDNKQPLLLTYNGPKTVPTINTKSVQ